MNTEIFFLIAGVGLCAGVFGCVVSWAAILKASEISRDLEKTWEVISEHKQTQCKQIELATSQDRAIILFARKIYALEQALKDAKEDLVTQKQIRALIRESMIGESH